MHIMLYCPLFSKIDTGPQISCVRDNEKLIYWLHGLILTVEVDPPASKGKEGSLVFLPWFQPFFDVTSGQLALLVIASYAYWYYDTGMQETRVSTQAHTHVHVTTLRMQMCNLVLGNDAHYAVLSSLFKTLSVTNVL